MNPFGDILLDFRIRRIARRCRWRSSFLLAVALTVSISTLVHSDEFYKWTDESGNLHFSDSLESVPEKYRNQIQSNTFENDQPSPKKPPAVVPSQEPSAEGESGVKPAKRYEVSYTPHGESEKRIIVTAVFNGSVTAPLAIDTGAPDTFISPSLAEKLGLFEKDQGRLLVPVGGIGGSTTAIRSIVDTIEVGGAVNRFVPVMVSKSISKSFEGLLGLDFVSNFAVTIDTKRNKVIFEELPLDAEHPGGHDQEWWTGLFKEFAFWRSEWKDDREKFEEYVKKPGHSNGEDTENIRFLIDFQVREADKLLDKLDRYARENSVPMSWRQY
ncbi:MAG TPA: aspartyl protease family protein [Nitrospiria bacterium]|nr:aspartyl protease family protein [Nitrospiria bacterium]